MGNISSAILDLALVGEAGVICHQGMGHQPKEQLLNKLQSSLTDSYSALSYCPALTCPQKSLGLQEILSLVYSHSYLILEGAEPGLPSVQTLAG